MSWQVDTNLFIRLGNKIFLIGKRSGNYVKHSVRIIWNLKPAPEQSESMSTIKIK